MQPCRVSPGSRFELDVPTLVIRGTADVFFDVKSAHWLCDSPPSGR